MSNELDKLLGKTKAQKILENLKDSEGGLSLEESQKISREIHVALVAARRKINSRPRDYSTKKLC